MGLSGGSFLPVRPHKVSYKVSYFRTDLHEIFREGRQLVSEQILFGTREYKRYTRKALHFFVTLQYLNGAPGDLLCQSSPIWVVMYSKAPCIKLPNFVCF